MLCACSAQKNKIVWHIEQLRLRQNAENMQMNAFWRNILRKPQHKPHIFYTYAHAHRILNQ
jgi:hypothetical protein